MQGTSFAFVGVLAGIAATQGLGVALTSCIIGGLIHFALGSVIANIRYLFPPLVTGLVILAIGLYLVPVGIKYAAGGAADFQMAASFGSLMHWTVALQSLWLLLDLSSYKGHFIKCRNTAGQSQVICGLYVWYG